MTEGRTYRNLLANPNASYLYVAPGDASQGTRFTLRVREIRGSGEILDTIRSRAKTTSGEAAARELRYVALFEIVEERPLV